MRKIKFRIVEIKDNNKTDLLGEFDTIKELIKWEKDNTESISYISGLWLKYITTKV